MYQREPDTYTYRSLGVYGNRSDGLLSIEGRRVRNNYLGGSLRQSAPPVFVSLSSQQLNPERIQRALASTYLDTARITFYEKGTKSPWLWPFEKYVPELNGLWGMTFTE